MTYCAPVLSDVEVLAGELAAAERILRELCDELGRRHDYSHLASRASDLAEVLYGLDRLDEAEEWTRIAVAHTAPDDLDAQLLAQPLGAKIAARRGSLDEAEARAAKAIALSESTDALNRRAKALRDLGEVLRLAGRRSEAALAFEQAIGLYEQKGNIVGAARAGALEDELAFA
jgi:tetratricopeptide (TPR) repeat protein